MPSGSRTPVSTSSLRTAPPPGDPLGVGGQVPDLRRHHELLARDGALFHHSVHRPADAPLGALHPIVDRRVEDVDPPAGEADRRGLLDRVVGDCIRRSEVGAEPQRGKAKVAGASPENVPGGKWRPSTARRAKCSVPSGVASPFRRVTSGGWGIDLKRGPYRALARGGCGADRPDPNGKWLGRGPVGGRRPPNQSHPLPRQKCPFLSAGAPARSTSGPLQRGPGRRRRRAPFFAARSGVGDPLRRTDQQHACPLEDLQRRDRALGRGRLPARTGPAANGTSTRGRRPRRGGGRLRGRRVPCLDRAAGPSPLHETVPGRVRRWRRGPLRERISGTTGGLTSMSSRVSQYQSIKDPGTSGWPRGEGPHHALDLRQGASPRVVEVEHLLRARFDPQRQRAPQGRRVIEEVQLRRRSTRPRHSNFGWKYDLAIASRRRSIQAHEMPRRRRRTGRSPRYCCWSASSS